MNKREVKMLRCKVTNPQTGEEPKETNALLIAGDTLGARVLLDRETKTEFYNWGWITFEKESELTK